MFNKKDILETVQLDEDKLLLSRVLDQVMLTLKYHEIRFTDYLSPYQQKLILQKIPKGLEIGTAFWGGYSEAERNMLAFFPDYMDSSTIVYPISSLEIAGKNIGSLSHRDFLGSILGLGIKREKIGDILVDEQRAVVFVASEIADFITLNLNKVGKHTISIEEKNIDELVIPQKKFKLINATVASLRIDSVLSAAMGKSRSKVTAYISSKKVNVNWEPVKSPSQLLVEGDVLSVKGHGRMVLEQIGGVTKKDRIHITIKRFI